METAFPFTTFKRQKHLTATVQITEPLRILLILEVIPKILIQFHEPLEAFLVAGQLIALEHRNRRFDMYPPELLVPLQLLLRRTLRVQKIENPAIFLIPAQVNDFERYFHAFFDQCLVTATDSEVHHEPKGLQIMTRVNFTTLKAINRFAIHR